MADLRVPDLNRVFLAGRLTRDPDLRYSSAGTPYCRLGLANTRYYKSKDGTRQEETCFVDVAVWGRQAEWVGEKLKKGRPVIVEGSLRSNEWEDKDTGQRRKKVEVNAQRVTPLDWDDDRGGAGGSYGSGAPASEEGGYGGGGGSYGGAPQQQGPPAGTPRREPRVIEEPIPEDDIPF